MKKFILGLGTVTAAIVPVATVVACGDDDKGTTWTPIQQAQTEGIQTQFVSSGQTTIGYNNPTQTASYSKFKMVFGDGTKGLENLFKAVGTTATSGGLTFLSFKKIILFILKKIKKIKST